MSAPDIREADLPLPPDEFADRLIADIDAYIEEHELATARFDTQLTEEQMRDGLYTRIFNEIVAIDLPRRMMDDMGDVEDPQPFVHLLKQIEDEAKHARMLSQRLWNLGGDPQKVFERADQSAKQFWEQFTEYDAVEMTVMLQCGAERMAQHRHPKELKYYDEETAEIYERVIVPEEQFHAKIGVNLLRKLCNDRESQEKALRMWDEGRDLIRTVHDKGIQNAFGAAD